MPGLDSALKEYVTNWEPLIEALPYPMSVHDMEFGIVTANKAFRNICGKADIIGAKCYQLIHCTQSPIEDCPMARALRSGTPEIATVFEPTLNKHLLVQISPIVVESGIIGAIHSVMDITDMKNSEAAYKEVSEILGDTLNAVKQKESDALRSRDAFLNMLEDISESYKELEEMFMGLISAMVGALDAKSPWTKGHSERVANYAEITASEMGLEQDSIKDIRLAGLLHDIGKIGTYDLLLDKPAGLTNEEFSIVKRHPVQGAEILRPIRHLHSIIPLIRHHHERIDGRGYPDGLRGEDIPLGARILHVADSFDSMTADRPYRPSPGVDYAVSELVTHSGTQFDSKAVEAFLRGMDLKPGA